MDIRLLRVTLYTVILLLAAALSNSSYGQSAAGGGQNAAGGQSDANSGGVDAGSLDKLLDLAEKDVGQLSNVNVSGHTGSSSLDQPVSTVERQVSTVGKTPAAVFVITNEMIRRSGAKTIPDVLRMVPGMDVANIDSSTWAVSSRRFNKRYAEKMLVQIDGRTIYDPLFSGVYWDAQDILLEDVERIEVIRGPGATIWGSNAVNGVINILTKKAQDTQGAFIQSGGGTHEKDFSNARVGGRIGQDLYYRVYGKWFERGPGDLPNGIAGDDWRQGSGGFRMDYDASKSDAMTFQGDNYNGYSGDMTTLPVPTPPYSQTYVSDGHISGNNFLYRWIHTTDEDRDWTFQAYYDRVLRNYTDQKFETNRDTADFDFQNRFPLGERNKIIWGFEYKFWQDTVQGDPFFVSFVPESRYDKVLSFFLQDQITLREDRLYLIGGSKFEYNDYTNFEFQPTVRLLWTPTERHSIWCAVSRAVRTPSLFNEDARLRLTPISINPVPVFPMIIGNPGVQSEDLLAYELGIRVQPTERFSWDLALFYNKYDDLMGVMQGKAYPSPPGYILPLNYQNVVWGESYGAELALNYKINQQWRMQMAYTYLNLFLHTVPGATSLTKKGDNPNNQVYAQSSWDIGHNWEFDLIGRYVDALISTPQTIPNYFVMDARLAWHARKNLELSVVGRNLLLGSHYEFNSDTTSGMIATQVAPEVYGQVTWRY